MNDKELREFQERERVEKERTDKAQQQTKAAQEKENVWKADAQKKEADNHDKAIKDNVVKEQKALKEAHDKEAQRVKSLNEKAKEKPREQRYNPVFDRAGLERAAWQQQQQRKQQQQRQPREPRHYDRAGEDGMTRELNSVKQVMCKKEATQRLEKMTPEQRDTLKKSFEADMAKVGDHRKLTDAGLHHKLSEKIMDDRGVPRPDWTDLQGIAAGMSRDGGRQVYADDIMRKHERERYIQPEKAQTQEKGKEPRNPDHPAYGKGPKGPDKPHDGPTPDHVRDPQGTDKPGPTPAHAKPWHEKHGGHPDHASTILKDKAHAISEGEKPWNRPQHADPDRAEARMAQQSRAREREDQTR